MIPQNIKMTDTVTIVKSAVFEKPLVPTHAARTNVIPKCAIAISIFSAEKIKVVTHSTTRNQNKVVLSRGEAVGVGIACALASGRRVSSNRGSISQSFLCCILFSSFVF